MVAASRVGGGNAGKTPGRDSRKPAVCSDGVEEPGSREDAVCSRHRCGQRSVGPGALKEAEPIFTPAGGNLLSGMSFAPFGGAHCPGGSSFGTTFRLMITAGVCDLTLDSVTLRMLDGSNLGGPSVTIPSLELARRFGSTFIRAGTTRGFGLSPSFDCVAIRPRSLRGDAFVFDDQRRGLIIPLVGKIQ